MLELEEVSLKVAGETHLYPTSLRLADGSMNTLLGDTLSGKTSLLRLMAGLTAPSMGRIRFQGSDVTGLSVQRRNVSMVYQQFINYPNLSVRENIASPLKINRLPDTEIRQRVGQIAELLKLTPYLDRAPSQLSGGQQQRTAIARALVKDSKLVLLDEPFANLDYKLRESLRDELPKLLADRGAVVVYATTEPSEALQLGGSVATLFQGAVTQFGPSSELYRDPSDLRTAQILSDPPINIALGRKTGSRITLSESVSWELSGETVRLPDGEVYVGLRSHHIYPENTGEGVQMEGRVRISVVSGSESVIRFERDAMLWVCSARGLKRFNSGEIAPFWLDVKRALYFQPDGRRLRLS
jgi:glycerol transport system ATP-binding protein